MPGANSQEDPAGCELVDARDRMGANGSDSGAGYRYSGSDLDSFGIEAAIGRIVGNVVRFRSYG
jgi:hypothetical protein